MCISSYEYCNEDISSGISSDIECNRIEYDINRAGKEKDMLISQLKAKIFELELREKSIDVLNDRFTQLQSDFMALSDCINHLECEKKLRDEELNQHIKKLQCEKENLQIGFNEKLSNNKNLYSENNSLGKQIELKDLEIFNLSKKLKDLEIQLNQNNCERENLQKMIDGLINMQNDQSIKLSKLAEDNSVLKQICQEQDQDLKDGDHERQHMAEELICKNNNIKNLNCEINSHEINLNDMQMIYNKNNNINIQFENNIKEYQRQLEALREDNENLKNNFFNEKNERTCLSQKNAQLSNILIDREQKINQLLQEIENIKILKENDINLNNVLQEENIKLRNHIMTLTEMNLCLNNEIDNVIEEDEKMSTILNRKERISSVLINNKSTIDQSLNSLDECINLGNCFESRKTDTCFHECH